MILRNVLFSIGAMLIALPAFAVDPIFTEDLARAAFLKTEAGRAIVREVIRDARGAPEWLNRQNYRSFLIALDYEQNRELAEALEDHLSSILAPVQELRESKGGAAPTTPMAQKKEEEMVLKAAERELEDPTLMDLATVAQEKPLRSVSRAMRGMVLEAMPMTKSAMTRSAQPGEAPTASIPGLPEDTGKLDLYPTNPKMKRGLRAKTQITRDLMLLIVKYFRDSKTGVLPTPEGFTPAQARDYHRNFYINVRQLVRMFDGYNDYARDQYVYEIFSNVKRPAYAALNIASQDALRKFKQGEITSIAKLIEAQKKASTEANLDIPEVVWEAHKRILYTIERLTQLCGTKTDGEPDGEIAETTRNLKHDQDELTKIEQEVTELRSQLDSLKKASPSDAVAIRQAQQKLLNREIKVTNWTNKTRKQVNMLASYYTEVVQLAPRIELFNYFREGLMNKGMISETYVGALDMHDIYVVSKELKAHITKYQDYAEGTLMSMPDLPEVELPDMSARVMPMLVKSELGVLRNRVLGRNKDFANLMNKLCLEASGQGIENRRTMSDLAAFIEEADKKLSIVKKALGIVGAGTVTAGFLHHQLFEFAGWCHVALEPVLRHIVK